MAKLLTRMYQNNVNNEKTNGKFYGRFVYTETLSTDEFAKHIADHGSPFDRSTIQGVIMAACDCLVELLLDSKKVRLGDLGIFYMSAESTGADSADEFTVDNIKRAHLRFLPNQRRSYPLDSVTLRKQASLRDVAGLTQGAAAAGTGTGGSGTGGSVDSDEPIVENPD